MSPDDLIESINRNDAQKNEEIVNSENSGCLDALKEFFGEIAVKSIFCGLTVAGFWFISKKWSWVAFLIVGLLFMAGIPAYFLLKRNWRNNAMSPLE